MYNNNIEQMNRTYLIWVQNVFVFFGEKLAHGNVDAIIGRFMIMSIIDLKTNEKKDKVNIRERHDGDVYRTAKNEWENA